MPGAVVLVVILLLFPVIVGIGSTVVAALLGHLLWSDADHRHEGSELVELNV
jgi:hypothetical protein